MPDDFQPGGRAGYTRIVQRAVAAEPLDGPFDVVRLAAAAGEPGAKLDLGEFALPEQDERRRVGVGRAAIFRSV